VVRIAIGTFTGFDEGAHFGLIAPTDGSPMVIVHEDNFGGRRDVLPGTPVKYSSVQGTPGPKAYNVTVLDPDSLNPTLDASDPGRCKKLKLRRQRYADEITSLLIAKVSCITATEIIEVRKQLVKRATRRGWLELPNSEDAHLEGVQFTAMLENGV
jgi:cold shock CspA family protein